MATAFANVTGRLIGIATLALVALSSAAFAQQPFQMSPFGGPSFFGQPFGGEPAATESTPRARVYIRARPEPSRQNAYCVRTCDGRYFPYPAGRGETDVKACDAVCPATEMKLYAGAEIKTSTSETGKPYEKLANAFRFQREMVANCTCNAKMGFGLTPISVRDDRTLRSGDIIAETKGLMVATVSPDSRHHKGSIMFRPLSDANARMLGLPRASLR